MESTLVVAQPDGKADEPSSSADPNADCQLSATQAAVGTAAIEAGVGLPLDKEGARAVVRVPPKKHSAGRTQQLYASHFEAKNRLEAKRKAGVVASIKSARLQLQSKQLDRALGEHVTVHEHLFKMAARQREKIASLVNKADQTCRFQPQFSTTSRKSPTKVDQEKGIQRTRSKLLKMEEEIYKECTFQPNIRRTKVFNEEVASTKEHQGPIHERLYRTPEEQAIMVKQHNKTREEKELLRCPFRPNISATQKSQAAKSMKRPSDPVHKRLYSLHKNTITKQSVRKGELAAEENKQCSFNPTLVAKKVQKEVASTSSVFERLFPARNRAAATKEVDPECTFSPQLVSRMKGVHKRLEGHNRIMELYKAGKTKEHRRAISSCNSSEVLSEKHIEEEFTQCTFKPDISPTAKSRFKKGTRDGEVFDRLYSLRDGLATAREDARQEGMAKFSFSPELVSQKAKIGRAMAARRETSPFDSLHEDSYRRQAARDKVAQANQKAECPFKPKLATASIAAHTKRLEGRTSSPTSTSNSKSCGTESVSPFLDKATIPCPPPSPSHTSQEGVVTMPPAAPTLADEEMGQGQEEGEKQEDAGDEEMGIASLFVEEGDMSDC